MKLVLNVLLLLLLLFVVVVIVNEFSRVSALNSKDQRLSGTTINSSRQHPERCSWSCHDNTAYCKANHVKLLTPYFEYTDRAYFGIINGLRSTGNYGWANVVFLVVLLPALMILLLLRILQMRRKIRLLNTGK